MTTETDRELLELAAKGAGMPFPKWNDVHGYLMIGLGGETKEWNPLTDDGDALRLAVKLRMNVQVNDLSIVVYLPQSSIGETPPPVHEYPDGYIDHNEPTRRAIVRAAASAEIGKAM